MTADGRAVSVSEFIESSINNASAFTATVAGREDEAAMAGYAELGVPWHSGACQSAEGLQDVATYRAHVGSPAGAAWMDNTTIVTAVTLMSEAGTKLMTPLTIWDLATFMRAAVCYERIYHHEHPDIDDAKLNAQLGSDLLVSVPLPIRYTESILPDPWDGAHRLMCETWFSAIAWLERLNKAIGTGSLDGRQMEEVTNAWRSALGRPDLKATDLVDFQGVDRRWRSPSNQLLVDTANVTSVDETIVSLDPDESIERVFKARRDFGLHDSSPEMRADVLSDINLRSYVNQRLAEFFMLPYACSVARIPFRNHLYDRSISIQQKLIAAGHIDDRYAELADKVQLRLPVFLAVALRSANNPQDLWHGLAELRDSAVDFREHREEMDRHLSRRDLTKLTEISKALHTSVESLLHLAGGATTAAVGVFIEHVSKGDVEPVSTGISATIAATKSVLKSSFTDRMMWRLRAPELLWVNDIVDQAQHLTEAMPDFARIWKIPPNTQAIFAERFQKMALLDS